MSWRPKEKEWDDMKVKESYIDNHDGEKTEFYRGIEVGADLIIDALKVKGHHVNKDTSYSSLGERHTMSNKGNTGTWVFIPD